MYHFNRIFRELRAKNLTARIHLRKHDEGKKIAATFNEAVSELDRSVSRMKQALEKSENRSDTPHEIAEELAKFKTSQG